MKILLPAMLLIMAATAVKGQAIDPSRSAKAEVMNDARFIDSSIEYNEDVVFLCQRALERSADAQVRELATQLIEDNSGMLYSMQQLQIAGSGSSKRDYVNNPNRKAILFNEQLSRLAGRAYDTVWVNLLLDMHQERLEQLTRNKETVRNSQLRMAITEATTPVKKGISQLRALQKHFVRLEIQRKKEEAARLKEEQLQQKLKKR